MRNALMASTALIPVGAIFAMASPDDALQALRDKLQAETEAAEAIVAAADEAGEDLTEEQLEQIEKHNAEADRLKAQISAREKIAASRAGAGRRTTPEPKQPGAGNRVAPSPKVDARTGGFKSLGDFAITVRAHAMGLGEGATNRLMAANTESVGEDGGFLVPPEFREGIMKVVEGEDSLLSRTDGSTTARNAVAHPKDETAPWGTSGIQFYWEGEAQSTTPSSAKFKGDMLRLNKLMGRVDVSDELLEDAPQMDNYLRVKAPEVMTSVINLAIVQGNGVGKPLGIMNSGALVTVPKFTSQPADTFFHRNVVAMWTRMYAPCRARAVWLMNQDVEPQLHLMSFRDVGSTPSTAAVAPAPIYMPPGGLNTSPYGMLMGRPVIFVQAMETLGDLGDVVFADLSKYRTITKAGGARIDTSIHLKFDTDETVFRFIFRLAGSPWWSAPISPRDGNNTLSAFVTLESR